MTEIGLRAIDEYDFPPFIDGSCRREPDFENEFPSITSLCRQDKFAPNLYPNDIVAYITVKGKWFENFDHYRLISIFLAKDKKHSHSQAASWYKTNNNNSTPSNRMIPENPPYNFKRTMGNYVTKKGIKRYMGYSKEKQDKIGKRRIEIWNDEYLAKAKKWGDFVITKTIFKNYHDPPIITIEEMIRIFGKVPNTRNPNKISREELRELAIHADINFIGE